MRKNIAMFDYLLHIAWIIFGRLIGVLMIAGVILFLVKSAKSAIWHVCKPDNIF